MSNSGAITVRQDYPALTALRGVLAVVVVLYHFQSSLAKVHFPALGIIERGHVAVSAFFVLSGFILSKVYLNRKYSLSDFFRARFARVYPTYFLGVVAIAPIVIYSAIISNEAPSGLIVELILTILCLQSWSAQTWHTWNLVGWSICCEAFFYVLFPFLTSSRQLTEKHLYLLIAVLAAAAGLGHEPSPYGYQDGALWVHQHSPIIRLPEFCLGVAMALLPKFDGSILRSRLMAACLSALLVVLLHFSIGSILSIFIPLIWACLIWLLASPAFQKVPGVLLWLGQISYPLYIFHVITAIYSKPLAVKALGDFAFMMQIAICFPVAHYAHKFFEVPLREKTMAILKLRV